jgi:hypothetical protein
MPADGCAASQWAERLRPLSTCCLARRICAAIDLAASHVASCMSHVALGLVVASYSRPFLYALRPRSLVLPFVRPDFSLAPRPSARCGPLGACLRHWRLHRRALPGHASAGGYCAPAGDGQPERPASLHRPMVSVVCGTCHARVASAPLRVASAPLRAIRCRCPSVGDLKAVRIGHDNGGAGTSAHQCTQPIWVPQGTPNRGVLRSTRRNCELQRHG